MKKVIISIVVAVVLTVIGAAIWLFNQIIMID